MLLKRLSLQKEHVTVYIASSGAVVQTFSPGERLAIRTESSEALPKGTIFVKQLIGS